MIIFIFETFYTLSNFVKGVKLVQINTNEWTDPCWGHSTLCLSHSVALTPGQVDLPFSLQKQYTSFDFASHSHSYAPSHLGASQQPQSSTAGHWAVIAGWLPCLRAHIHTHTLSSGLVFSQLFLAFHPRQVRSDISINYIHILAKSPFFLLALVFQEELCIHCHVLHSDHPPCDRCVYMKALRQLMRKDSMEHDVLRDLWIFSF